MKCEITPIRVLRPSRKNRKPKLDKEKGGGKGKKEALNHYNRDRHARPQGWADRRHGRNQINKENWLDRDGARRNKKKSIVFLLWGGSGGSFLIGTLGECGENGCDNNRSKNNNLGSAR